MTRNILLILLMFCINSSSAGGLNYAVLSGYIAQIEKGDSVRVTVNEYGYAFSEPLTNQRIYKSKIENHCFSMKIPVSDFPIYAEIRFGSRHLVQPLNGHLLERGDRVFIRSDSTGFAFTGKGAEKFSTINQLRKINQTVFNNEGVDLQSPVGLKTMAANAILCGNRQLNFLQSKKNFLSTPAYILTKAMILGSAFGAPGSTYWNNYAGRNDSLKAIALSSIRKEIFNFEYRFVNAFNKNIFLKYSGIYADGLLRKYQMDSCYLPGKPFRISACYQFVKANFTGALRDRLVTDLFYYYRDIDQDISAPLTDAVTIVKNQDFLVILNKLKSNRIKGSYAFNFKLADTLGNLHGLSEYQGKVVVLDFWYTGCGNCIKLAPYLSKIENQFQGKPVVFLSICVDRNRSQWLKSIANGEYTSNQVINLFTNGLGLKDPVCLNYDIISYPTLILIDKNGRLMRNPKDPRFDNGTDLFKSINIAL